MRSSNVKLFKYAVSWVMWRRSEESLFFFPFLGLFWNLKTNLPLGSLLSSAYRDESPGVLGIGTCMVLIAEHFISDMARKGLIPYINLKYWTRYKIRQSHMNFSYDSGHMYILIFFLSNTRHVCSIISHTEFLNMIQDEAVTCELQLRKRLHAPSLITCNS